MQGAPSVPSHAPTPGPLPCDAETWHSLRLGEASQRPGATPPSGRRCARCEGLVACSMAAGRCTACARDVRRLPLPGCPVRCWLLLLAPPHASATPRPCNAAQQLPPSRPECHSLTCLPAATLPTQTPLKTCRHAWNSPCPSSAWAASQRAAAVLRPGGTAAQQLPPPRWRQRLHAWRPRGACVCGSGGTCAALAAARSRACCCPASPRRHAAGAAAGASMRCCAASWPARGAGASRCFPSRRSLRCSPTMWVQQMAAQPAAQPCRCLHPPAQLGRAPQAAPTAAALKPPGAGPRPAQMSKPPAAQPGRHPSCRRCGKGHRTPLHQLTSAACHLSGRCRPRRPAPGIGSWPAGNGGWRHGG